MALHHQGDQDLFDLSCILSAKEIHLSARIEVGDRQLTALVTGSGNILLHYLAICSRDGHLPVIRSVTWFKDPDKRICAMVFHPAGTWLLVTGVDGSVMVVPALCLVECSVVSCHQWSPTDVTMFPSALVKPTMGRAPRPTALAWWQTVGDAHPYAILATDEGHIYFLDLASRANLVGQTCVDFSSIVSLHVCEDESMDMKFLLITGSDRVQWRLMLEQQSTGYTWPFVDNTSGTISNDNSIQISSQFSTFQQALGADYDLGPRNSPHLPTARSRLQGLKQLSVEKLNRMRQKLAETRCKSTTSCQLRFEISSSSDENNSVLTGNMLLPSTGPHPEKLDPHVEDTYLWPQYTRDKCLLSGLYAPSNILTVHDMSWCMVPLDVYKLPPRCQHLLVTDRFLYITIGQTLLVLSCHLSEILLDRDREHNPDSILQLFELPKGEVLLSLYRCRAPQGMESDKERPSNEAPPVDTCILVTSAGIYQLSLRRVATEIFMDLVLLYRELGKAQRLSNIFGLNIEQLLETAGDEKLAAKDFRDAIAFYELSRCRHLKRMLKFAAGGHSGQLLNYICMLFSTASSEVSPCERIHLSNLAMLSHTEKILRSIMGKRKLVAKFLSFLDKNTFYDEMLAVSVMGQTGLWESLTFLANNRGLHKEVFHVLVKIIDRSAIPWQQQSTNRLPSGNGYHFKPWTIDYTPNISTRSRQALFWECVSNPQFLHYILLKPAANRAYLRFVSDSLAYLDHVTLQKLAAQLYPSSPVIRPILSNLLTLQQGAGNSNNSNESTTSNSYQQHKIAMENIIETLILVLLHLIKRQVLSCKFYPALMKKMAIEYQDKQSEVIRPSVPVKRMNIAAGFSHAGVLRQGVLYTWGFAARGCLGVGPTMSKYLGPSPAAYFIHFKLEVLSFSMGHSHTVALTNNGVYTWGSSVYGQLGLGKVVVQSPYPKMVESLAHVSIVAVSAGQYHTLALTQEGRVYTWGWGVHGQLGHGSIEDLHIPTLLTRLADKVIVQVCGGHGHSLMLTAEGEVYSFGSGVFGQLGTGCSVKCSVPRVINSLPERIILIDTKYFHNLAVSISNTLYMWGASPHVLRLEAQAQKKARHLQQLIKSHSNVVPNEYLNDKAPPSCNINDNFGGINDNQNTSNFKTETTALGINHVAKNTYLDIEEMANVPTHKQDTEVGNSNTNSLIRDFNISQNELSPFLEDIRTDSKIPVESQNKTHLSNSANNNILANDSKETVNTINFNEAQYGNSLPTNTDTYPQNKLLDETFQRTDREFGNAPSNVKRILNGHDISSKNIVDQKTDSCEVNCSVPSVEDDGRIPDITVSPSTEMRGQGAIPQTGSNGGTGQVLCNLTSRSDRQDDGQIHNLPRIVNTCLVQGPIVQISCGCHHSALVTEDGTLYMWGRSMDGQVGNGSRKEVLVPAPLFTNLNAKSPAGNKLNMWFGEAFPREKMKVLEVSTGCEFTAVLESPDGRVFAWGSNSYGQLGKAPKEDTKNLEGRCIMIKQHRRMMRIPQSLYNSVDIPHEVLGIAAISQVKSSQQQNNQKWWIKDSSTDLKVCPPLASLEGPCYGPRTLHFVLQHFFGLYNTAVVMKKFSILKDYQAGAKVALLSRKYEKALSLQLEALTSSTEVQFPFGEVDPKMFDKKLHCSNNVSIANTISGEDSGTVAKNTTRLGPFACALFPESETPVLEHLESFTPVCVNYQHSGEAYKNMDSGSSNIKHIKSKTKNYNEGINERHSGNFALEAQKVDLNSSKAVGVGISFTNSDYAQSVVNHSSDSNLLYNVRENGNRVVNLNTVALKLKKNDSKSPNSPKGEEDSASPSIASTPDTLPSSRCEEMHAFAVQGGLEQMSEDNHALTATPSSLSPLTSDSSTLSEITGQFTSTPTYQTDDSPSLTGGVLPSSSLFEKSTGSKKLIENAGMMHSKEGLQDPIERHNVARPFNEFVDWSNSFIKITETSGTWRFTDLEAVRLESREDVALVSEHIVNFYCSVMEDANNNTKTLLLQKGILYWLKESLPIQHLENILQKQMDHLFYPLGLLFFCKNDLGSVGTNGTSEQPGMVLNNLSKDFCIELCSTLLSHLKEMRSCTDYVELLARTISLQSMCSATCTDQVQDETGDSSDARQKTDCDTQERKQPMDVIVENLQATFQPYISFQGNMEGGRGMLFSCGHQYDRDGYLNVVMPELQHKLEDNLSFTAAIVKKALVPGQVVKLCCPRCLAMQLLMQRM